MERRDHAEHQHRRRDHPANHRCRDAAHDFGAGAGTPLDRQQSCLVDRPSSGPTRELPRPSSIRPPRRPRPTWQLRPTDGAAWPWPGSRLQPVRRFEPACHSEPPTPHAPPRRFCQTCSSDRPPRSAGAACSILVRESLLLILGRQLFVIQPAAGLLDLRLGAHRAHHRCGSRCGTSGKRNDRADARDMKAQSNPPEILRHHDLLQNWPTHGREAVPIQVSTSN